MAYKYNKNYTKEENVFLEKMLKKGDDQLQQKIKKLVGMSNSQLIRAVNKKGNNDDELAELVKRRNSGKLNFSVGDNYYLKWKEEKIIMARTSQDQARRSKQGWERGRGAPRKGNPRYKPVVRKGRKVYVLR